MKQTLVQSLRCPVTGQPLQLTGAELEHERVRSGTLTTPDGAHQYPIVNYVPRFVPAANYAHSFGLQWNRFAETQLGSRSGTTVSRDRFLRCSGWRPEGLAGRRVLDVGCGAGRFAEVALAAG